ncbi:hypothetical protein P3L51_04160 [Streptomyces sp. PSRA5]|uniref:hypothetical protein n=1 Tax=Streptomyces panacea TaxID=3035064 RepID=UPI00339C33B5
MTGEGGAAAVRPSLPTPFGRIHRRSGAPVGGTAAGSAVNWSPLLPLPVLLLVGVAMAPRIRGRDPARCESLGVEDVEG